MRGKPFDNYENKNFFDFTENFYQKFLKNTDFFEKNKKKNFFRKIFQKNVRKRVRFIKKTNPLFLILV